jgi:hypothetical protein
MTQQYPHARSRNFLRALPIAPEPLPWPLELARERRSWAAGKYPLPKRRDNRLYKARSGFWNEMNADAAVSG